MTETNDITGQFKNGKWIEISEPVNRTTLKVVSKLDDYTRVYLNDIQLGLRSINIEQSGRNFMLIDLALMAYSDIEALKALLSAIVSKPGYDIMYKPAVRRKEENIMYRNLPSFKVTITEE